MVDFAAALLDPANNSCCQSYWCNVDMPVQKKVVEAELRERVRFRNS
jgi:hypothetical protein